MNVYNVDIVDIVDKINNVCYNVYNKSRIGLIKERIKMCEIDKLQVILEFKIEEYNKELEELEVIRQKYEKENNKAEVAQWSEMILKKQHRIYGLREALATLKLINK